MRQTASQTERTSMFILSIVLITLALVFYTIGVWSERIQGELK